MFDVNVSVESQFEAQHTQILHLNPSNQRKRPLWKWLVWSVIVPSQFSSRSVHIGSYSCDFAVVVQDPPGATCSDQCLRVTLLCFPLLCLRLPLMLFCCLLLRQTDRDRLYCETILDLLLIRGAINAVTRVFLFCLFLLVFLIPGLFVFEGKR